MRYLASTLILLSVTISASAQAPRTRLDSLLDKATAIQVNRLLDSAGRLGLPVAALAGVAMEGVSRHAESSRIVSAAQSYFGNLVKAKQSLGESATPAELTAGAGALLSGVTPLQLQTIRKVRPGRSLTLPLVVLADLAARGVPVDTATRSVYVGLAKGMPDEELTVMRRMVEQDILNGLPPGAAAVSRLQKLPGMTLADFRRFWPMSRDPLPQ